MLLQALNKTDERIEDVRDKMLNLGSPTIRYVDCAYGFLAIEGSHRIAAASDLQIPINLIEVLEDDDLTDEMDILLPDYCGDTLTVADLIDYIGVPDGETYDIDDDGRFI